MKIFSIESSDLLEYRLFPDGESYIRLKASVKDEPVAIWCSLNDPNPKIPPLLFLSKTLKDNGASSVTLIAPYLCYMRQDKLFHEGEAFNARHCAELMSPYFDHIITVDPHLHRIHDLSEIYSTKTTVLHADQTIMSYIQKNLDSNIYLIGPDQESEQWIAHIAKLMKCPYVIARKERLGDTKVYIYPFEIDFENRLPVVIDDIASSGTTLIEIQKKLPIKDKKPITIIVHALFAQGVYERLQLFYSDIITTNTISHKSNKIDLTEMILSHSRY